MRDLVKPLMRLPAQVDSLGKTVASLPSQMQKTADKITHGVETQLEKTVGKVESAITDVERRARNDALAALRAAERRAAQIEGKIEAVPVTVMRGLRALETSLTNRIQTLESTVTKEISSIERSILGVLSQIIHTVQSLIRFLTDVFETIGSYLTCGVTRISRLPRCWYFYVLEMLGALMYLPVSLLVWLASAQQLEREAWDALETLDAEFHAATMLPGGGGTNPLLFAFAFTPASSPQCPVDPFAPGARVGRPLSKTEAAAAAAEAEAASRSRGGLHLIHFPDWVLDDCYRCSLRAFPDAGKYF